ncbi:MAG: DUF1894 domain-containing protein [Methanomicrobiales archaeon]|nr:DUF1894 domain-containing protein [Methanomicrobiales archaeon]MDI6875622.1 DUF1894 domain-containing protein [Methanomicrobiales archaeon]
MACIEELNKEVILSGATFQECRKYVEGHYAEVYYVDPGYKIFDKYIIGVPPIAIGIEGEAIVFPFTKPCYGTYLLRIRSPEEIARVRKKGRERRS